MYTHGKYKLHIYNKKKTIDQLHVYCSAIPLCQEGIYQEWYLDFTPFQIQWPIIS